MRVAISFDYDSPAGYRQAFAAKKPHASADMEGTDALLRVLAKHGVRTTFAVVGNAALEGPAPEHAPDQIRAIHHAGHEVASHSMQHRFIPPMRQDELLEDLYLSKRAIEQCIGTPIRGFIPPFNRPVHFPEEGSYSYSELVGSHGRGRGRQSISSMLTALERSGFGWCRVSFQSPLRTLMAKIGGTPTRGLRQPFLHNAVVVIPLAHTGFSSAAETLVRQHLDTELLVTLYGHPFQALDSARGENSEHADQLDRLLGALERERTHGKVTFVTMADVEMGTRGLQPAVPAELALSL
jgi:peptidoglycan/xylan/chitin deacetylase (PgdA/CDA1 family)